MDKVKALLRENYDVKITNVFPVQGGWASLAYKVFTESQRYFLKVYEKDRASTPKLTSLIDQYVPIMVWLMQNSKLEGKISIPFLTYIPHP